MCVLLHGDAAFAGQGVVPETFMLSRLEGYSVAGTVHIIVNNQVGFTAESTTGRSSRYASDIGKIVHCPVLHVNAEDVEATVAAARLATEYRNRYGKDVIIDLIGYRKHGHNEVCSPPVFVESWLDPLDLVHYPCSLMTLLTPIPCCIPKSRVGKDSLQSTLTSSR